MEEIETHPVQTRRPIHGGAKAPAVVTKRAYEVYCHIFGAQEAMVTGNCRGGFSCGELIAFLYAYSFSKEEWNDRFNEACNGMEQL